MKKNVKNLMKNTMVVTLVAGLAIGGTLAYLSDATQEIRNTFVFDDDYKVDVELDEEFFNEDGTPVTPHDDPEVGGGTATFIPGDKFTKDPVVTNVEQDAYIFLLVRTGANFDEIMEPVTIKSVWSDISNGLQLDAGYKLYAYAKDGSTVAPATKGEAIDVIEGGKVSVKPSLSQDEIDNAADVELSFTAFAVQGDNVSVEDATAAAIEMVNAFLNR